jgi:hypothetical protein
MNTTISTHTTALEAHIVRGRLKTEGVPAFVVFENHIWANWSLSVALGGVRVQVPPSYVEKAGQIITDITTGKYQAVLEEETDFSAPLHCAYCNSVTTVQVNWPWKLALLAIFLLGIPIPYTQHLMKCERCSRTWVASEQRGYPLSVPAIFILVLGAIVFVIFSFWCEWCKLHCEQPICI